MSRVLARTSMISDERMLNTATRMMIDSTTNIATRSTASASNSCAFIVRQSVTTARPPTLRGQRREDLADLVGDRSSRPRSCPTASPISSSVCASSIGMTTKALS